MRFLSLIGNGYVYPFIVLILFYFDPGKAVKIIFTVIIAFLLELPIQLILKKSLKRKRPCHYIQGVYNLVKLPDEFSFPSGHTAAACILAVILSSFYSFLIIPSLLFCILMGLSRIYNGVHYPSDVLCGALLGISCSYISLLII